MSNTVIQTLKNGPYMVSFGCYLPSIIIWNNHKKEDTYDKDDQMGEGSGPGSAPGPERKKDGPAGLF